MCDEKEKQAPGCLSYLPDSSGIKGRIGYLLDTEMNLISLVGDGLPMNTVTAARIMNCYNACSGIPDNDLVKVAFIWDALNEAQIGYINPIRLINCVKALDGIDAEMLQRVVDGDINISI